MVPLHPAELLARAASLRPRNRMISWGKRTYSYGECERIVRSLACKLRRLNIGGRVVVSMPASPEFIFTVFALFEVGAIPIPVNPGYTSRELGEVVAASGASALSTREEEKLSFRLLGTGAAHGFAADELIGDGDVPSFARNAEPSGKAVMFYTSGSTGQMKGVVHTFKSLCANPHSLVDVMGMTADDIYFLGVPLFHLFGFSPGMLSAVLAGAEVVLSDTIGSVGVMDRLQSRRVSVLLCNATMLQQLLTRLEGKKYDVSALRMILTSGSIAPEKTISTSIHTFCRNTLNLYGTTETGIMTQTLPGETISDLVITAGRPLPGIKIRIVNSNHEDLPVGSVGEIACHTYGLFCEYHNMPSLRSSVVDQDGWYYTGDMGSVDERGYLRIIGRKDEMIIKSGFNVYPREIELVLLQHPKVVDAAVVGVPDPASGQVIRAVVAKQQDIDLSTVEILDLCQQRLVSYKVPDQIFIVEQLPLTSTGKIRKSELKKSPFR